MLKKIFSVTILMLLLCGVSALGADCWSAFKLSGASKNANGSVTISSQSAAVASLLYNRAVAPFYTFETAIAVDTFSHETGIQLSNGEYRLMVYIREGEIEVKNTTDATSGTIYPFNVGNTKHTYKFITRGESTEVYIDGSYMGKAPLQPNTAVGRICFWAKSDAGAAAVMTVYDYSFEEAVPYEFNMPLSKSYDVKYHYNGAAEGTVSASDGFYSAQIIHTKNSLTVCDGSEEKELLYGEGDYKISVESGIAQLYFNERFIYSFYLAPSFEKSALVMSLGSISDAHVSRSSEKCEIYKTAWSGTTKTATFIKSLNYVIEFDKKDNTSDIIDLFDGTYEIYLEISNTITAKTCALGKHVGTTVTEQIADFVPTERSMYRVEVTHGIAKIFIDNSYVTSFRAPAISTGATFTRTVANENSTTFFDIASMNDVYTFRDDFETDGVFSSDKYWNTEQIGDNKSLVLLNVSADNPIFKTRVKIGEGEGSVWLVFRYHNEDTELKAGYDFETKLWTIENAYVTHEVAATAEGECPIGEWIDLEARLDATSMQLYCNGELVISADNLIAITHGRLGFLADRRAVDVDYVDYAGDGMVSAAITYNCFDDFHTVEFVKKNDGTIMMIGISGGARESHDNGLTWQETSTSFFTNNTIRLASGALLAISRVAGDAADTYWDEAYLSYDDGQSCVGPFRIETRVSNRITMNNKLIQATDGRIYFCAGESGDGEEKNGALGVYYSDDDGYTWTESRNTLTLLTTGVNVQEGKIIELPDGTMRCYMRTDLGFLYTSDSHDRGVTWDMALKPTPFISTCCAFNIERDAQSDTYYMVWEYDNTNHRSAIIQQPRSRLALAVSYDGCETWEFITDLAEIDNERFPYHHANAGLRVYDDIVLVDVLSFESYMGEVKTYFNRVYRLDKNYIRPLKRFSYVHPIKQ